MGDVALFTMLQRDLQLIYHTNSFIRTLIHHSPSDLLPTIYLLSNHLKPSYVPLELGVGFQILNKAVVEVSGASRETLKRLWDKWGDPGDVAFEAKVSRSIEDVADRFSLIKPKSLSTVECENACRPRSPRCPHSLRPSPQNRKDER